MAEDLLPAGCKGCVFDCDGTILHTMQHHWNAWKAVTKELGLHCTLDKLKALAGKPSTEIFKIISEEQRAGDVDITAATIRKTELYIELATDTVVIQSVMDIADAAKERGIPCAIATGGQRKSILVALEAAGLADYFDAIVTADDITPGHGKPHPETFLLAAKAIGVDPSSCVGYEDAVLGFQAIQAAGFLKAIDVTTLPGYPHITE